MYTLKQASIDTCIPINELIALANRARFHYKTIEIKKRNGSTRTLHAPSYKIKGIQTWILRNILDKYPIHECATGFHPGASVYDNAKRHAENTRFLQVDVSDFFTSIKIEAIHNIFSKMEMDSDLCRILTLLCSYRGFLPQGGVTSPSLSNLFMYEFDDDMFKFCNSIGYTYTRYADDITISGHDKVYFQDAYSKIYEKCKDLGLSLNTDKTRYSSGKSAIKITGLFVNSKRPTVGRKLKRRIRASLHNSISTGTEISNEIHGQIAFVSGIDSSYKQKIKAYKHQLVSKFTRSESAS